MSYDNDKQIILSKVVSDNPKAPKLRVTVEMNGQKWQAGLWEMTRRDKSVVKDKNGNTLYKGTLEIDDYQGRSQPANSQPQSRPEPDSFDDSDLPF